MVYLQTAGLEEQDVTEAGWELKEQEKQVKSYFDDGTCGRGESIKRWIGKQCSELQHFEVENWPCRVGDFFTFPQQVVESVDKIKLVLDFF